MSSGGSLYRRHRPQAFDEVVGQQHVVRTLRNAVERDRVHHAYLFVGSRGTGKTSLAKILARSLNCEQGPTVSPCGACESCRTIAAGTSLDVIEMDAASNRSVDDIRELRERVGFVPAAGRFKVYILDEAHMLTREAWNAFLKTLEEPPPNTVFVLATTEAHKVMPTIVDRCQRFDFQRPGPDQIAEVIRRVVAAESIEIDDGAIGALARAASGSFRDALGTLDQLVAYGGKRIETDDVLTVLGVADSELLLAAGDAIAAGDGKAMLELSERLSRSGRDPAQFGRDLLAHLRQLLVLRTAGEAIGDSALAAGDPERMRSQAGALTDLALSRAIDSIAKALADVREGDEPRMTVELALLKAARPQLDPSREALLQRIEALEAGVGPPASGGRPAERPSPTTAHAPPTSGNAPPVDHPTPDPDEAEVDEVEEPVEAPESPVAQAVEAAVELDLEKIVGLWPAVVDQVRQSGEGLLSHVLSAARPVGVDAEKSVVQVGFPPSAAFNKRKAETPDALERFGEAVRAIVGRRLRPDYVLIKEEDAAAMASAEISPDELVARFKAEFGAEEFESDPPAEDAGGAGEAAA